MGIVEKIGHNVLKGNRSTDAGYQVAEECGPWSMKCIDGRGCYTKARERDPGI